MKKLEKGFTLIELMIVVAIIAILAAVAAPKFGVQIKKAHDAKGVAALGALRSAAQMKYADNTGVTATQLSYVDLKAALETKTQALVPNVTASGAGITVGYNKSSADVAATGTVNGVAASETQIVLDQVTTEGTITVSSTANQLDAKGTSWSAY